MSKEDKSRDSSDEQPENIRDMSIALEVSRPDRSREESDEQPENMPGMSVVLEASRPDRSRDLSDEQPQNMEDMLVAPEASRPDRSRDLSDEQSRNMPVAVGMAIAPSIFAEIIKLPLSCQGALSNQRQFSSSPRSSPSSGAITRQPLASIIQRAVPLVVQSTIGSPDSPDCGAAASPESSD